MRSETDKIGTEKERVANERRGTEGTDKIGKEKERVANEMRGTEGTQKRGKKLLPTLAVSSARYLRLPTLRAT
jgi:hypothetical protein